MTTQNSTSRPALTVEIVRDGIVESEHKVSLALVDVDGRQLLGFGELTKPVFLRSSAKPFQVLPFVEGGHAEDMGISDKELSILCSSHSGTDEHAILVEAIMHRVDLVESHLLCGTHTPFGRDTAHRLIREAQAVTPLRHNCSGKHAGMLLFSIALGSKLEDYLLLSGNVQQRILEAFSTMVDVPIAEIGVGIDGCSAPNFAVSLPAAAFGFARLMDPSQLEERRTAACRRIVGAMIAHPEMVAGQGRFDTACMQTVRGRLLAKGGAEGYQAIGIPSGRLPSGASAGLTLKVHDGDAGKRALGPITIAVLNALGILSQSEKDSLSAFDERPLHNFSELVVGEIRLAEETRTQLLQSYERI